MQRSALARGPVAGVIGVGFALAVAVLWFVRQRPPVARLAIESTVTVTVTRHDPFGMPEKPVTLRDRERVRALVAALGVDAQPDVRCPPDYASAELGILLGGADVYARRNVYVWGANGDGGDGGDARVVVVAASGCRGGPPADAALLQRELRRL